MLHYSNASSVEKSRRYLVIKGGGLAWLLWQERGVVNSVVELVSSSVGLVVYRREEGKEIMNTEQKKHHKIYQGNTRCSVCPNGVVGDTGEGGKHPGKYSRCFVFSGKGAGGGKLRVR